MLKKMLMSLSSENKRWNKIYDMVNLTRTKLKELNDDELKQYFFELNSEQTAEILSVGAEALSRVKDITVFPEQIRGGLFAGEEYFVEMKPGEGKTYSLFLSSLLMYKKVGKVYISTISDYLSTRDFEDLSPVFEFLGISVGNIVSNLMLEERQKQYASEIIFSSLKELGFDYLKNGTAIKKEDELIKDMGGILIDEADLLLLDEASTPLVLSSEMNAPDEEFIAIFDFVQNVLLKDKSYYEVEEGEKSVHLTVSGLNVVEDAFAKGEYFKVKNKSIIDLRNSYVLRSIRSALEAILSFKKNVDYIVENDKVVILNEFTGRKEEGVRLPDGIHQFLEVKEGIPLSKMHYSTARMTITGFINEFTLIGGMSGTLKGSEEEFLSLYGRKVIMIKPRVKSNLKIENDLFFIDDEKRINYLINYVKNKSILGHPVLIVTQTTEEAVKVYEQLLSKNIKSNLLTNSRDVKEAELVKEAGKMGKITVSTIISGRGTDIVLGGGDEKEKKELLDKELGVIVVGYGRGTSFRADEQIVGRTARQGDPGESVFMLSPKDFLFEGISEDKTQKIKKVLKGQDYIQGKVLQKVIYSIQSSLSSKVANSRKGLVEREDVVFKHLKIHHANRRKLMDPEEYIESLSFIKEMMTYHFMGELTDLDLVEPGIVDVNSLHNANIFNQRMSAYFGVSYTLEDIVLSEGQEIANKTVSFLMADIKKAIDALGVANFVEIGIGLYISALDEAWSVHLYDIELLMLNTTLHEYSGRKPLVEFKNDMFKSFNEYQKHSQLFYLSNLARLRFKKIENS